MNSYSLSQFEFDLPESLIAQKPVSPRDHSRLMVIDRKTGAIEHANFFDLPRYLHPGDLLVANNSKVFRARLLGNRLLLSAQQVGTQVSECIRATDLGGKVEFFLLEKTGPNRWEGLFKGSAKAKLGLEFLISAPGGVHGKPLIGRIVRTVGEPGGFGADAGTVEAEFNFDPLVSGYGEIPLPPYIHERTETTERDYQTLYASQEGSAAAPTAGLHFTEKLRAELLQNEVSWAELTLHVGIGTFRPVKVEDIREHQMHQERVVLNEGLIKTIAALKREKTRLIAVGTTSLRALEGAYDVQSKTEKLATDGSLTSGTYRTDIFFYPGANRKFNVVDSLITNFHLPRSTLLMLVSAFAGAELIKEAYAKAIEGKYRFFSYGDAMLIV